MRKLLSQMLTAALAVTVAGSVQASPLRKVSASSQAPRAATERVQAGQKGVKGLNLVQRKTKDNASASRLAQRTPLRKPAKAHFRAPLRAPESFPELRGVVIYSEAQDFEQGMYTIPMSAAESPELIGPGVACENSFQIEDGMFYAQESMNTIFGSFGVALNTYDMEDWSIADTRDYDAYLQAVAAVAIDPTTNTVYAPVYNEAGDGLVWGTIDLVNATVTRLTTESCIQYIGLACNAQGQIYGVDGEGQFGTVDKATGALTVMSTISKIPNYLSSATIDSKTGRFFMAVSPADETGWMIEVDTATGETIYEYELPNGEEIVALHVPAPAAEPKAPGACSGLSLSFADGSLSGSLAFNAPANLFDGTPGGTEDITYHVLANGTEVATGTTWYGAGMSAGINLDEPGNYTFVVYCSNEVGNGPKAKISQYVGNDTPVVKGGEAKYANGEFQVTWDAVTEGFNGGYVDPASVTYDVWMYSSASDTPTCVAEGTTETSVNVPVTMPAQVTTYYFTITATSNGLTSAVLKTNSLVLGNVVPPYTWDFEDADLSTFTVIDANGDEKTWIPINGMVRVNYNSDADMDDWLITAPIQLEAGKSYKVSFKAYSGSTMYGPEKVEAKWGDAPTVAAMTNALVEPTEILTLTTNEADAANLSGYITPQADGLYYVGIHGISAPDVLYLYVDDLSIAAGIDSRAPGAPGISVMAAPTGDLMAIVNVKAPEVDFAGNDLDEPVNIKIYRNGEFCGSVENKQPGTNGNLTDYPTTGGMYTYTAVAENSYGEGPAATTQCFVGVNIPAAPQNVQLVETEEGCVKLTWDAIDTDKDTLPLASNLVKYNVISNSGDLVAEGLTSPEFTTRAVPEGEQAFVYYAVYGVTDGGDGESTASNMIPVGTPTPAPYFESGEIQNIIGINQSGGGAWGVFDDSFQPAADGDNACFACKGSSIDNYGDLFTGKIAVGNLSRPALSFYTYNIVTEDGEELDENTLEVFVTCDGVQKSLTTVVMNQLDEEGWNKVIVDLGQYQNKVIQLTFRATTKYFVYTMLDAISVYPQVNYNLTASQLVAPAKAKAGQEFNVDFTVVNNGLQPAHSYTVALYMNGSMVGHQDGAEIAPNGKTTFSFPVTLNAMSDDENVFTAKILWQADQEPADNDSKPATTVLQLSSLPAPQNLSGEAQATGNALTWDEPDLSDAPEEVTEDFEQGESWATELEGWTIVDRDGGPVGGFSGITIPGWTAGTDKSVWKVFDTSDTSTFNESFKAHSGVKYMASMFNYDGSQNDEWLISPMLYGGAQTISFWAKSYSTQYGGETIRVWYSTTGTEIEDFVEIPCSEASNLPADWTEISVDLPAGAKYFAINCYSKDVFMLMLDDITYTRSGNASELTITGYNVYRDGQLLTTVEDTNYLDVLEFGGEHTYAVTVVYTKGESAVSNIITINNTSVGIDAVAGESLRGDVYNLQGMRLMQNATVKELNTLPAGIYIHAGRKVMVK